MMELWIWVVILVATLLIEVETAGTLVSIWFSLGALVALIVYWLGGPIPLQVIMFLVVAVASLLAIRPLASNYFRGNIVPTNQDRIIGAQATLLVPITSTSWGQVKVFGSVWSAQSIDKKAIEEGQLVEVIAIEGAKLIVKAVN
jgi:membrane protein implicated in regulation of membrane protease activity